MPNGGMNGSWRQVIIAILSTATVCGAGTVATLAVATNERPTRSEMRFEIADTIEPIITDIASLEQDAKELHALLASIDKRLAVLAAQNERMLSEIESDA